MLNIVSSKHSTVALEFYSILTEMKFYSIYENFLEKILLSKIFDEILDAIEGTEHLKFIRR